MPPRGRPRRRVREPEIPEEPARAPDLVGMIAEAVEVALDRREAQRNPPQVEEQAQEEEVLAQEVAHDDEQEQDRYMKYLAQFQKLHPASFSGGANPDLAESWLFSMVKTFKAIRCPAEYKVALAIFTFTGDAEHWWRKKTTREYVIEEYVKLIYYKMVH